MTKEMTYVRRLKLAEAPTQTLDTLVLSEATIQETVERMALHRRGIVEGRAPEPILEALRTIRAGASVGSESATAISREDIWWIVALAWIVNDEFGPQDSSAHMCTGSYGLSDSCQQGCTMCSFSDRSDQPSLIANPEFKRSPEEFVAEARRQVALARAHNPGARIAFKVTHIGMGLKGNPGLCERYVEVLKAVRAVEGIDFVDACMGLLDQESAEAIAPWVHKYNNNLERIQRPGEPCVTTEHTLRDKVDTLRLARSAGMGVCSGVLFGAGESTRDKIDSLALLRDLVAEGTVGSSPVNAFVPVYQEDVEMLRQVSDDDVMLGLALARIMLPSHPLFPNAGRFRYGAFLPAMHAVSSGYSSHHNYLTKFVSGTTDRSCLDALAAASQAPAG